MVASYFRGVLNGGEDERTVAQEIAKLLHYFRLQEEREHKATTGRVS